LTAPGSKPNRDATSTNARIVAGSIGSAPLQATRNVDRSSSPGATRASWRVSTAHAKLGAVVIVPP
jgi:hypothetical protein